MDYRQLILALALVATQAHAKPLGGYDLAQWSSAAARIDAGTQTSTDVVGASYLDGYVLGIHDAYLGVLICTPSSIKVAQLAAITQQFIKSHPERWNEPAAALVLAALQPVFPCKIK